MLAGASVGLFISLFFVDLPSRLIRKRDLDKNGVHNSMRSLGMAALEAYLLLHTFFLT
jgi:hypothetical protein